MKKTFIMAFALASSLSAHSWAETVDSSLLAIQKQWAQINYEMPEDAQENAFKALLKTAQTSVQEHPNNAEYLIWQGIVQSSTAGAQGGLGALSLAKDARKSLEQSIENDASALNGSAYTSLGVLYHKVPGWPVGFGSDKKAQKYLTKALELNPQGIDSNYFYAEFLYDDDKYQEAKEYLLKAQQAAPRPDRPLADKGRQTEVERLLAKVNDKLK